MVALLIEKETIEKSDVERLFADVPKRTARGELPRRLVQDQLAAAASKEEDTIQTHSPAPAKPGLRRPGAEPTPA